MPHLFDRDGAGRRIETPAAQYHVFKYEQPLLALGVVVPVRIEAGRRREGEPTCQFLVETRLIDACVAAHVVARPVRLQTKTLGKAGLGTGTVGHEIGRASCRERVCQYVLISVVAVSLKKKKKNKD